MGSNTEVQVQIWLYWQVWDALGADVSLALIGECQQFLSEMLVTAIEIQPNTLGIELPELGKD